MPDVTGLDIDEATKMLKEANLEQYTYQLKIYLFCQALAEHYNYKISDKEIDEYIEKINSEGTITKAKLVKEYGLNYVKAMVMYEYIQDYLFNNIQVNVINKES